MNEYFGFKELSLSDEELGAIYQEIGRAHV